MTPVDADIEVVARAAEIVVTTMPHLAISFGAFVGGKWRHYPTARFLDGLGFQAEEYSQINPDDLANPHDLERIHKWITKSEAERSEPLIFHADKKLSHSRWLELHLAHIGVSDESPTLNANFYILRDVDVEVNLEKENRLHINHQGAELDVLESALNATRDGFAIWKAVRDADESIVSFDLMFINDAGAAPTGNLPRHLIGSRIDQALGKDQSRELTQLFCRALDSHAVQSEVVQIDSPSGWVGAYQTEVVPFSDDRVLDSFRDVSDEQRERDRLNWLAEHDHLTGLPNRRALESVLKKSLARARKTRTQLAFAFVDIDDFKVVNDTRGHSVGDQLLQSFAARMRQTMDNRGVVARLSGDEFALILDDVTSAEGIRHSLDMFMQSMRRPFDDGDTLLSVTCSAGVAICSGHEAVSEVLKIADNGMYRAKHDGKNRYTIVHAKPTTGVGHDR